MMPNFAVTVWLRDLDCEPLDEPLVFASWETCSLRLRAQMVRMFPEALDIEINRV